jgi:hypothetical protein
VLLNSTRHPVRIAIHERIYHQDEDARNTEFTTWKVRAWPELGTRARVGTTIARQEHAGAEGPARPTSTTRVA